MNPKKTASQGIAIALFLGLMTNLGGCEIGNPEGGEGGEGGDNTEQTAPATEENDEGGEGGEGGEGS
jgi:hypothetical protein